MLKKPVIHPFDHLRALRGRGFLTVFWLTGSVARMVGLRVLWNRYLAFAVRKTGLFDNSFYFEQNPDVAENETDMVLHYVAHGDREGRQPMAIFDSRYYRRQVKGAAHFVNSLLHYAYVGRYLRRSPSPWFDVDFYIRENKDVQRSGIDPLRHYINWGGLEGRSPCIDFDGAFYLQSNPDVRDGGINPLIHYLTIGRLEGLEVRSDSAGQASDDGESAASGISLDSFNAAHLMQRAGDADAAIDVLVPVFRGRRETLACLYSVLSAYNETKFELVVIDDQIPESQLKSDCASLAAMGLFSLLVNDRNIGFVASVNRGIALHQNRDIVLLNSDTEVYDRWLDRLVKVADVEPRISSVTPLSNNATICSYPRFLQDNPYPLELGYSELDALAADVNDGELVEAPTGVGFCMLIKRACLDAIGDLDEAAFGKGYGEENDFCQRAIAAGWKNVIAPNVFVRHWGGSSFKGEKFKLEKKGLETVARRYPRYLADVAAFIKSDPLSIARSRIDAGRMKRLVSDSKNILIVCHSRGGGTERHVREDAKRFRNQGWGVFLMRPVRGSSGRVMITSPFLKNAPNVPIFSLEEIEVLGEMLKSLCINEVHTHSLVDFSPEAPLHIKALVAYLQGRWEINLHDYKVACPRVNMVDRQGMYCGEPSDKGCDRCLLTRGSDFGIKNIRWWRDMHWKILESADQVLVPDRDVKLRLARYFPGLEITVSPHEQFAVDTLLPLPYHSESKTEIHIVVIGAIGKIKGYDVLKSCAADAKKRGLAVRYSVLGFTTNDAALSRLGVEITGKYHEEDAVTTLLEMAPDLVWLPSIWPETYSYTLSVALQAGCRVAAFDLGAIASRLRALDRSDYLMPLEWARDPKCVNDEFVNRMRV